MIRGAVKLQEIRELGVPKRLSPCAQVDGALLALPASAATQLTSGSNAAHRANQVQLCGQRAGCNGPASYMLLAAAARAGNNESMVREEKGATSCAGGSGQALQAQTAVGFL